VTKFSLLQVVRHSDFPWGRTILRFAHSAETSIAIHGAAEVESPSHETFLRAVTRGAAHLTIEYLFAGKLDPSALPRPEQNILGASFRRGGWDKAVSICAEPGSTLSVTFEPAHVVVNHDDGSTLSEIRRFELSYDSLSALKLETLLAGCRQQSSATVIEIIPPPSEAVDVSSPYSVCSDVSLRSGLRRRQKTLLEILAGLCRTNDCRTDRRRLRRGFNRGSA
jgi:hypothetical protein